MMPVMSAYQRVLIGVLIATLSTGAAFGLNAEKFLTDAMLENSVEGENPD